MSAADEKALILALTDEARAETAVPGDELGSRQVFGLLIAVARRLAGQEARLAELEVSLREMADVWNEQFGGEP